MEQVPFVTRRDELMRPSAPHRLATKIAREIRQEMDETRIAQEDRIAKASFTARMS